MGLKSFFASRSIRWKVLSINIMLTTVSIVFLLGIQVVISTLLRQAEATYASAKTTRMIGQVMASVAEMQGYITHSRLALEKGSNHLADDILICADEIKTSGLDVIGEVMELPELAHLESGMMAALTTARKGNADFVAAVQENRVSPSILDTASQGNKDLAKSIKGLEGEMINFALSAFLFVQKVGTINLICLIICMIMMLGGLAFSVLFTTRMMRRFESALGNVRQAAKDIHNKTDDLVSQSTALSAQATEGSAAVHETVSTLEEISSMVARTMERVNLSTEASEKNFEASESGRATVGDASKAMAAMKGSIEQFSNEVTRQNEGLAEVVKVINEIANKTKVINDIVFQTKLLSFNASVESARAGEHGRGFSVVAEEVGNLAKMSGTASKEISTMVESGVKAVTDLIETSRKRVQELASDARDRTEDTMHRMDLSGNALNSITQGVKRVKDFNNEILLASKEQTEGVKNISIAMNELSSTITANASSANATSETANKFRILGELLDDNMNMLESEVFGHKDGEVIQFVSRRNLEIADEDVSSADASEEMASEDGDGGPEVQDRHLA